MPQFPSQDFTFQYISSSYQEVCQVYYDPTNTTYLLDGLGYVIGSLPTASVGNQIVTVDQIIPNAQNSVNSINAVSSSFSLSSSYSVSSSISTSSSFSNISNLSFVSDVALLADTADTSISSISSSWASQSLSTISSSYSVTSSYISLHIEKGIITGSSFSQSPLIYQVNFNQSFLNSIYIISLIGDDIRVWSTSNRTTSSFIINSNSSVSLIGSVMYRVEENNNNY